MARNRKYWCQECGTQLDETPSGYHTCCKCNGKLLSRQHVNTQCTIHPDERDRLARQMKDWQAERLQERNDAVELPWCHITEFRRKRKYVFTVDDHDGLFRILDADEQVDGAIRAFLVKRKRIVTLVKLSKDEARSTIF